MKLEGFITGEQTRVHYFKQNLKINKEEGRLLHLVFKHAAKLYNRSLYLINEHFDRYGKYLTYSEVIELVKNDKNYKILGQSLSYSIIRNLDTNYKNYFKNKRLSANLKRPSFRKNNFFIYFFKNSIYNGVFKIHLTKLFRDLYSISKDLYLIFKITSRAANLAIKSIRLQQYFCDRYYMVIEYYSKVNEKKEDNGIYLGIDFGLDNLMSCYSNTGRKPFIVKGGYVKYANYKYFISSKTTRDSIKRKNRIDFFYDRTVNYIFRYCLAFGISKIMIGDFKGIKDSIRAKNFYFMPFHKLKIKFRQLGLKYGIEIIFTEESYTSKASFFHGDSFKPPFSGSRVKRGLYKIAEDKFVNADINGAANIIRKVKNIEYMDNFLQNPRIIK